MSSFQKLISIICAAILTIVTLYVGATYATTNYVPGTTVGRTYENSFMDVRIDLPDNYYFPSSVSVPKEVELFAISPDGMCNIGVVTDEIFPLASIKSCMPTIQKEIAEQAFNTYQITYTLSDATFRYLAGQQYYFMRGDTTYKGVHLNQDIYLRKIGSRCCAIVITYSPSTYQSTGERDALIKCISSYKK